ncbi:M20 family metallopeptidase [bacterium]|nr:M20 family metallopeptidase [bacterium]
MDTRISRLVEEICPGIIVIRHDLHKHPEIGLKEYRTAAVIETFLDDIGVTHRRCTETGVVAEIGRGNGHVVALRADIDALEMPDLSGLPYASVHEGLCHACGHDGHTAVLLGTAWVLRKLEHELAGTVKLIFQPDEEGGTGADTMIRQRVLGDPAPEAIFALHGWPDIPLGKVGYRFGPAMASVNSFRIIVRGKGTHGAMPHAGVDPVTIAARIIGGIQLVRSRMTDPLSPFVVTVGTVHGGTAVNIIPDEVTLGGTIRTLDPATQRAVHGMLARMAEGTARASGGEAEFAILDDFPPTINEDRSTALVRDVISDTLGPENAVEIKTSAMGGEDFSFFLRKVPGSFFMLGVGGSIPIHNTSYDFDDRALPVGIRIMSEIAVRFIGCGLK